MEEGIVPGGGTAYVNVINKVAELTSDVTDTQVGINIIVKALRRANETNCYKCRT